MTPDERTKLLNLLASLYEGASDNNWQEANDIAELVLGVGYWPEELPGEKFRIWLDARIVEAD